MGKKYETIEEFFSEANGKRRNDVKDYILRHNLLPYKCSNCGNDGNWMGQKMSLQLHHIDGNPSNNQLENLTLLCPNCHAITENYGNGHAKKEPPIIKYCANCGNIIGQNAILCRKCNIQSQRKFEISREELKELIKKYSWREIGRMYNVSDTSIKKRCRLFNLPDTKTEIKNYSDEEWELL